MQKIQNEQILMQAANPLKVRAFAYNRFTYPWHFHSEIELLYVDKGEGRCIAGDRFINYKSGDLLLFGSELPHCMQNPDLPPENTEVNVSGLIIQLEKDFMQPLLSSYSPLQSIGKLLHDDAGRGVIFHLQSETDCTNTLYSILKHHSSEQFLLVMMLLQKLIGVQSKEFMASPQYDRETMQMRDRKIEKIISYLNKHYVTGITLTEVASLAAMNPSAFCRYFKEVTGKTFKGYLSDMRIGYACKLLADQRLTISQISSLCGFESVTHFNRVFKQITHCSPTGYRAQLP